MARQWPSLRGRMDQFVQGVMARPALPPPHLTADVYERQDGTAYVVEMAVPSVKPDEIVIEATPESITVTTQPQQRGANEGRRYIQREQSMAPMGRVIEFPDDIDTDHIEATLEHGILTLHVPKAAAGRRKVIRLGQPASKSGG
jgi:HSP20 family protein